MTSAIILAAGASVRMKGANKLLLPWRGLTSLQTVAANVLAAGIGEVIVVTGHEAEAIEWLLSDLPITFVHNADHRSGMTVSIQAGVGTARGAGYMICLADMPFITPKIYADLTAFFETTKAGDPECICVPEHEGRRGQPVIFSRSYKDEILAHRDMEGCKSLLQKHAAHLHRFDCESDAILRDIDTPEDYRQALEK